MKKIFKKILLCIACLTIIFYANTTLANTEEVNFDPYMRNLERKIKTNWKPLKENRSRQVVVLFKIAKDGSLISSKIVKSSGSKKNDKAALDAIENSTPFTSLPVGFKGSNIEIQFSFDYNVFGYSDYVADNRNTKNNNKKNTNGKSGTKAPKIIKTSADGYEERIYKTDEPSNIKEPEILPKISKPNLNGPIGSIKPISQEAMTELLTPDIKFFGDLNYTDNLITAIQKFDKYPSVKSVKLVVLGTDFSKPTLWGYKDKECYSHNLKNHTTYADITTALSNLYNQNKECLNDKIKKIENANQKFGMIMNSPLYVYVDDIILNNIPFRLIIELKPSEEYYKMGSPKVIKTANGISWAFYINKVTLKPKITLSKSDADKLLNSYKAKYFFNYNSQIDSYVAVGKYVDINFKYYSNYDIEYCVNSNFVFSIKQLYENYLKNKVKKENGELNMLDKI